MQFSSYCLLLQTSSKKRHDCEHDALLSRLNVYIQRRYLTHFFQLIKIKNKIKSYYQIPQIYSGEIFETLHDKSLLGDLYSHVSSGVQGGDI